MIKLEHSWDFVLCRGSRQRRRCPGNDPPVPPGLVLLDMPGCPGMLHTELMEKGAQ